MPRQQQPPDPNQGATAAFAQMLYALRQAVGSPSYREMGERANISHTSLSRAAKGERFPTWGTTRAFVLACDADADMWKWRWECANFEVEAERRLQNAPTVPLVPLAPASPIYGLDPPENPAASTGGPAETTPTRPSAPGALVGELPALTRQLAAEIQAGAAAPTNAKPHVEPATQRNEQAVARHQRQDAVRLVPVGSGQLFRVVGTSSRPSGAHRKAPARRYTSRTATRQVALSNVFLGEPLWYQTDRVFLVAALVTIQVWNIGALVYRIVE